MMQYHFSRQAERDIEEIRDYIAPLITLAAAAGLDYRRCATPWHDYLAKSNPGTTKHRRPDL